MRSDSDVDIGLLYPSPPAATLEAQPFLVAAELESLLGRPVDIVVLNTAPVDLVHRVLRDGVLLLQPNPSARIAFEVRARNEYFDLLPILRRYRQLGKSA
jgi:predicted nucleotidyltransferase